MMWATDVMEFKSPETTNKIEYVDNYYDQPIDKKTEMAVNALQDIQEQANRTIDEFKGGASGKESPTLTAWNEAKANFFWLEEKIKNDAVLRNNPELNMIFTPVDRIQNLSKNPETEKQVQLEAGSVGA